ncbi:PhoD-like phosphatase [compost metagenome]
MLSISRRQFLQQSAGAAAGLLVGAEALAQFEILSFSGDIPIVQNYTNSTTAQFTILTEGAYPYTYVISDSDGKSLPWSFTEQFYQNGFFDFGIDKIFVPNLQLEKTYRLKVLNKKNGRVLDERKFKSLDVDNQRPFKVAAVSCACDFFAIQSAAMWNGLYKHRPDVILMVGDTCYADLGAKGTPSDIWRRYCETRLTLMQFRQSFLIPTLATWDDHDFGIDNGNCHFKTKEFAKKVFLLFWGSKNQRGYSQGLGVSSTVQLFGQSFYFMDDRSFRDTRKHGGLHWGIAQQEALLNAMDKNTRPTWLLNGSQFFGGYLGKESFESDHEKNFKDVLKKLSKKESPIIFLSGDVHFSEVMRIEERVLGYKTVEITSSSIHSATFPGVDNLRNPRRIVSTWHFNFVIIESSYNKSTREWQLTSKSYNNKNQRLFSNTALIKR